jgi:hypothetical protein
VKFVCFLTFINIFLLANQRVGSSLGTICLSILREEGQLQDAELWLRSIRRSARCRILQAS